MNERQKRFGEFVIARGNAPGLLDTAEETFDQIAVFVDMAIERSRMESVGTRRDNRLAALVVDGLNEGVRVVTLVGHDEPGRLVLDQSFCLLDIGDLSRRENDAHGIAEGIDGHVQLGGQSSPRATDFLAACFFGRPPSAGAHA